MAEDMDGNGNGLDTLGAEEDFGKLLEESEKSEKGAVIKDRKTEGTIVSIGEEWVFVDVGAKSEAFMARQEVENENGEVTVSEGDTIEAYVVKSTGEEILLSLKMTSAASQEALLDAYRSGVPVEGLVLGEKKGGFSVRVLGKEAFCPYSQIDLQRVSQPEDYVGNRYGFRIIEYKESGRNLVLSRRSILEEERAKDLEQLKQNLKQGDRLEGEVTNVASFGVFVDIGGAEGLIPMSELAWARVESASDLFSKGDKVEVEVLNIDWERDRITLSSRAAMKDPWDSVPDDFQIEKVYEGLVKKLMDFGAFVELTPGVEGLAHISNMSPGRRINHPREVLSEGASVRVKVISVDAENRRIGLELERSGDTEDGPEVELRVGETVQGEIETIKDYGIFVGLPGGKTGLLHVSEIEGGKSQDLRRSFNLGEKIQVEILDIDPESNRVSLGRKSLRQKAESDMVKDYKASDSEGASMGTLGDLLKDKLGK
jgi:small subunit ribosomal protein S1